MTRVLLIKENLLVFTAITIEHFKIDLCDFKHEKVGLHIWSQDDEVSDAVCIKDEMWLCSKTLSIFSFTDAVDR